MLNEEASGAAGTVDETTSTALTPESPSVSSVAASVDETNSSALGPDGQPRDEHGRFATRTENDAPVSEDGAPLAPVSVEASSTAETPQTAALQGTPFVFRAQGAEHPFPDAVVTADGSIVIPAARSGELKQLLSEGHTYRGTWRNTLAEAKAQGEQRVTQAESRAAALNDAALSLLDALEDPNRRELLLTDDREFALLKRELLLNMKQKLGSTTARPQPSATTETEFRPAVGDPQRQDAAVSTLEDEVLTLADRDPTLAALFQDATAKEALGNKLSKHLWSFYVMDAKGQYHLNQDAVEEFVRDQASHYSEVKRVKEESDRQIAELRKAQQFNASRDTKPDVPAAVPSRGSPAPSEQPKSYQSQDDWRRDMGIHG